MNVSLPSFSELVQALNKTERKMHASQVHGLICGLLCAKSKPAPTWQHLITGSKSNSAATELLNLVLSASQQQLGDFLFDLQLMLPTDEIGLNIRAEALGLWCQGYMIGLKLMQIVVPKRGGIGDANEAMQDLLEIAQMNYDDVLETEENEASFVELVEYIKLAVNIIYQATHNKLSTLSADASKLLH